jgi:hypothetical protein
MLESLEPGTYYWQVRYTPDFTNQYEADGGNWWSERVRDEVHLYLKFYGD